MIMCTRLFDFTGKIKGEIDFESKTSHDLNDWVEELNVMDLIGECPVQNRREHFPEEFDDDGDDDGDDDFVLDDMDDFEIQDFDDLIVCSEHQSYHPMILSFVKKGYDVMVIPVKENSPW